MAQPVFSAASKLLRSQNREPGADALVGALQRQSRHFSSPGEVEGKTLTFLQSFSAASICAVPYLTRNAELLYRKFVALSYKDCAELCAYTLVSNPTKYSSIFGAYHTTFEHTGISSASAHRECSRKRFHLRTFLVLPLSYYTMQDTDFCLKTL